MKGIKQITLDYDVKIELSKRKVNTSKLCNDYLRTYLNLKEKKITDIDKEIEEARSSLIELESTKKDMSFQKEREWKELLDRYYKKKVTLEEREFVEAKIYGITEKEKRPTID